MKTSRKVVIFSEFKTESQAKKAEKLFDKVSQRLSLNHGHIMYGESCIVLRDSILRIKLSIDIDERFVKENSVEKIEEKFKKGEEDLKESVAEVEKFLKSLKGINAVQIRGNINVEELLVLCKDNEKLKASLEKIQKNKAEHNRLNSITEFNGKWDAEDVMNFDEPTLGIFDENSWYLLDLRKDVSKLFNCYNWNGIKLSDGRLVFVTTENSVYIVKPSMMDDGGVESTVWGINREEMPKMVRESLYGTPDEILAVSDIKDAPIEEVEKSMQKSVEVERYEDAAKMRDELESRKYII